MNILISALHPVGGIKTYFRYVYSKDVFKGASLTLIAPDDGLMEFFDEFLPPERIKLIATKGTTDFFKTLNRQLNSGNYEIVHSHGFSAGIIGSIANYFSKVTHIMTGHDVFSHVQFSGLKGKVKKALLAYLFNRLDVIHTISNDARNNFIEYFPNISKDKFHFIMNGIDTKYFEAGVANNLRNDIGAVDGQPILGFFGRFMAQKGFRILVDAMKVIFDKKLLTKMPIVATFGWGGFVREDFEYIETLGLSDYFVQMAETSDMPANLKSMDLVVMPSRWEACPLLPMEALSAGVPIIGTNCLGLGEVLAGSPADILGVGNVELLAKSIVDNILNPKKALFLNYQTTAVKRFDVESTANKLFELYQRVSH